MNDSIGETRTQFFEYNDPAHPLLLRVGPPLPAFTLAYEVYGEMNADRSNVILLYHAMTGNQHAAGFNPEVPGLDGRWTEENHEGWWDGFIGPGKALDTDRFCVVCANYLGGCYGSTGPATAHPATGRPWGPSFPVLRMSDIVDSQMKLLDHLGVQRLHAVVGASIGGFLALLTSARYPGRVRIVLPIGTGVETSIYQRIINFEQVNAVESDPNFRGGDYYDGAPPDQGLALARRIAHKTFVSLDTLRERARTELVSTKPPYGWYEMNHPVESYMLHQGKKFVRRFDANSYLRILDAWQWFDLVSEAGATSFKDLFSRCRHQEFLVFSIDSDLSFPPRDQAKLVRLLKRAGVPVMWITVHSEKGHDAFLLEPRSFAPHIHQLLEDTRTPATVFPSS
ncbi:Homoserine O-acetyltransferase [Aquisphaera giovannonii]|uniref:Homoserine O-acetyltransferase n=1 Tax=Aquisphaera giovannonii TaxID=406548 RepID=A0A5B9VVL7_9BACT|nr:homoserine O-acetyltransferase [Aquisphaera giovannonii]QEH31977.1 Homoserine O-acetyltransferase [Aquisphaera giovannonii]